MPKTDVVDLSHNNGPVDMHALWNAGVRGMILKASEGIGFKDPMFTTLLARGRSVGFLMGAYHFLTGDDADAQWANYKATIAGNGPLLLCLDYEENAASQATAEQLDGMVAASVADYGRHPVLYGSDKLESLEASIPPCQAWCARYGPNPPTWAGSTMVLWQFSESGSNETAPDTNIDCSTWTGAGDMATWWASRAVTA